MNPSEIRPARPADLDQVLAIESAWETTPHWTRAQFEEELASEKSSFFVLERGGLILGYAVFWEVPPEAQLLTIAVSPESAGRGLGKLLLGRLIETARSGGLRKVTLEVSERNEKAVRLYARAGFSVVGRRPKFYNDGADAVLMDLALSP